MPKLAHDHERPQNDADLTGPQVTQMSQISPGPQMPQMAQMAQILPGPQMVQMAQMGQISLGAELT